MKKSKIISIFAMFLFLLSTETQAQNVTPSKNYVTKEIKGVKPFSSINVLGSPDVEYTQSSGSRTSVSVYGSDNLVDLLELSTVNGVLQVNIKKGVNIHGSGFRFKVIASSPTLNQVDIKGSSDVKLKGLIKGSNLKLIVTGSGDIDADNLQFTNFSSSVNGSGDIKLGNLKATNVDIQVNGSGDVHAKGSAQKATLLVKGSGDITADKLIATNVSATVSGSGDIDCYASKQLDAKVSGSGDIDYKGDPQTVNKQGKKDQISEK